MYKLILFTFLLVISCSNNSESEEKKEFVTLTLNSNTYKNHEINIDINNVMMQDQYQAIIQQQTPFLLIAFPSENSNGRLYSEGLGFSLDGSNRLCSNVKYTITNYPKIGGFYEGYGQGELIFNEQTSSNPINVTINFRLKRGNDLPE